MASGFILTVPSMRVVLQITNLQAKENGFSRMEMNSKAIMSRKRRKEKKVKSNLLKKEQKRVPSQSPNSLCTGTLTLISLNPLT